MKCATLSILLFSFLLGTSQNLAQFAVSNIPDSLLANANVVTRSEVVKITIESAAKGSIEKSTVLTVLNSEGDEALVFYDFEDEFRKLKSAEIKVYDKNGNFLIKYGKKQLEKQRANDGFSLVNDDKLFFFKVPSSNYPITVMFESTIQLKGFIDIEDITVARVEEAVQEYNYTIETPLDNPVRYKNYECNVQPTISQLKNQQSYNWSFRNIKAVKQEYNGDFRNSLSRICITTTYFEIDNYKGDFSSWTNFGKWYYDLSKEANDLSPEIITHCKNITNGAITVKDKAAILYAYLQQNYRYVSIQLGIGGFMPFKASFVSKNKYGDCKALSNYMQSLLAAIDVKSYQALINAGSKKIPVDPSFANNSFNHVILCVPNDKDTIWLECTSTENEFNSLGSFTENRNALLITENGGLLVPTPKSTAQTNQFNSLNTITIKDDLSASGIFNFKHQGEINETYKNNLWEVNTEDQIKFLINEVGFQNFEGLVVEKEKQKNIGYTTLIMDFTKIYEFNAGAKYFIKPHLFEIWSRVLPENKNRITDYFFKHPFIENDTTVYKLPNDFTIEQLPRTEKISNEYINFNTSYQYNATANEVIITTQFILTTNRIAAKQYNQVKEILDHVIAANTQKIIIKRK
jgi:hypothetical protein